MTSSFLDKKPPESLILQGLEGSTTLGKDEVTSSNLVSSSIGNTQDREVLGVFLCLGGVMRPIAEAADCRGIERQGWHPPEGETALASAGKTCYHRKDEMRGMRYAACDRRWELYHQRGTLR